MTDVQVKPLKWEEVSDRCQDADGMGKLYRVLERQEGADLKHGMYDKGERYSTVEAAKAAVQADYEARIRSALVPAPAVPDDAVKLWQDTADNDGFCQLLGLIPLRDTSTGEAIMWREKDGDFIDFAVALRDTIEAQAAELARLTYLQGRDQASRQHHMKLRREAEVEVARLRDENARLREALQDIMADRPSEKHNGNRNDLIAWQMWRRARAALTQPTGDRT